MKQADDLLRQACAEIAREEADSFEQSLTRSASREAEEAYRHHRLKALAVIKRRTGKPGHSLFLPLAAALLIVLGGAVFSMRHSPNDMTEQTQPPAGITVQPFYTAEPTAAPSPTLSSAVAASPTVSPTKTPIIEKTSTIIPTETPFISPSSTLSPTFTPLPTETPAPVPTATPEPDSASRIPAGWQGEHFPTLLPPGFELASVTREDDCCTAAYSRYGQLLTFTEYDHPRLIEAPENADYEYIQVNGIVVLQARTDNGVTLTWNMDGHTLSLFTPQGDGIDIAESVIKIPEP